MRPTALRPSLFARRSFQRGSVTTARHPSLYRPSLATLFTGAGAALAFYYGIQFQKPIVLDSSSSSRRGVRSIWDDDQPIASELPTPSSNEEGEISKEETAGQAAFNPETGEINWDCPCLGGMAHGPCGMEFRAAFSCFVYSEAEPKGMECVEKFKTMQDCFREHPDVYGEEINDSEDSEVPVDEYPSESKPVTIAVKESPPEGEPTHQSNTPSESRAVTLSSPSSDA